jgi:hypothetical protein
MVESWTIPNRARKTPGMTADRPWAHVAGLGQETWARPVEGSPRDASYGPKEGRRRAEFRKSRRGETGEPTAPGPGPDVPHQVVPARTGPQGRLLPGVGPKRREMSRGSIVVGPRPAARTWRAATVPAGGPLPCAPGSPRPIQGPRGQCAGMSLPPHRWRAATPWVAPARADGMNPDSSRPFRLPADPSTP